MRSWGEEGTQETGNLLKTKEEEGDRRFLRFGCEKGNSVDGNLQQQFYPRKRAEGTSPKRVSEGLFHAFKKRVEISSERREREGGSSSTLL